MWERIWLWSIIQWSSVQDQDHKTTSSLIKQLQTRIVEFVVLHLLLQINLESFSPLRWLLTDPPDVCANQI